MEVARGLLGSPASLRAVRATLFDKRPDRNWALGWQQDRTIAVKARCDAPGFGPWSRKDGVDYVEPPFDLLTRMLTVRAHLDPVGPDNAPLLIALGSHRLGRIAAADAAAIAGRSSCMACLAEPGDVWAYATPILHASDAATRPSHRRLLQIDFAVEELPGELMWLGV